MLDIRTSLFECITYIYFINVNIMYYFSAKSFSFHVKITHISVLDLTSDAVTDIIWLSFQNTGSGHISVIFLATFKDLKIFVQKEKYCESGLYGHIMHHTILCAK